MEPKSGSFNAKNNFTWLKMRQMDFSLNNESLEESHGA